MRWGALEMTDAEQFAAYMRVADYYSKRRRDRQDFEWKVTLAIWALIVLTIEFVRTKPIYVDLSHREIIAVVLAAILGFMWFRGIAVAHRRDSNGMWRNVDLAMRSIPNSDHTRENHGEITWWWLAFGFLSFGRGAWAQQFQFAATCLLLAAFVLFGGSGQPSFSIYHAM